jgi:hypothetical protein
MAWERTTKVEEQRRVEIRPISYTASKRTRFRKNLLPKRMMLDYIAGRIQGGSVIDLGCGDGHSMMGFPPSFRRRDFLSIGRVARECLRPSGRLCDKCGLRRRTASISRKLLRTGLSAFLS